jgi:hypothetical protein
MEDLRWQMKVMNPQMNVKNVECPASMVAGVQIIIEN